MIAAIVAIGAVATLNIFVYISHNIFCKIEINTIDIYCRLRKKLLLLQMLRLSPGAATPTDERERKKEH